MIRITSKRHNFRRCGMAHPKTPVDYPDDRFSEEELSILQAERMLTVEVVATEDERPDLTVREIKERLEEMGIKFSPRAKKEDLQKLLENEMSQTIEAE